MQWNSAEASFSVTEELDPDKKLEDLSRPTHGRLLRSFRLSMGMKRLEVHERVVGSQPFPEAAGAICCILL